MRGYIYIFCFSLTLKVISAKVVARSRSKSHRYGFVTMSTAEQAEVSIKALNHTELKGSKIAVELVTGIMIFFWFNLDL